MLHGLPADPHALSMVPGWQVPLPSQHPVGQLLLSHVAEGASFPLPLLLVLPDAVPVSSPVPTSSPDEVPEEEVVESSPVPPPDDELP